MQAAMNAARTSRCHDTLLSLAPECTFLPLGSAQMLLMQRFEGKQTPP